VCLIYIKIKVKRWWRLRETSSKAVFITSEEWSWIYPPQCPSRMLSPTDFEAQLSYYLTSCKASLGVGKMQCISTHPVGATKPGQPLEGQDSWRGSSQGDQYLRKYLLRLLWGRQKGKFARWYWEGVHVHQGDKTAGERERRMKEAGKASSVAGGKRGCWGKERVKYSLWVHFGGKSFGDGVSWYFKMFWNCLSLQHCFLRARCHWTFKWQMIGKDHFCQLSCLITSQQGSEEWMREILHFFFFSRRHKKQNTICLQS